MDDMPMPMTPPGMPMDDMPMMQMSFYWGKNAVVLFSGWPDHSLGMYVLALLFVLLLAAGAEVLAAVPSAKRGANPLVGAFGQAVPYAVRMGLAYLVMLSVMSFNGGIFVAAVVGHFLGFFFVKARALAVANRGGVEAGVDGEVPSKV